MSDHTHAVLQRDGHKAEVVFRTESGVNVGSLGFLAELEQAVDALSADTQTRIAVFRGEGKVFLAGADIKAMVDFSPDQARAMAETGHRVFDKIERLPQVTLAAIQGAALGGGCELAMACDLRFAVKSATLGQPEVHLGLIPGWGGTMRLPRLVPLGMAKRLLLTGEVIKGERALAIGLVDEIVNSAEDLGPLIRVFTQNLAKAAPSAVTAVKQAVRTGDEIGTFAGCFTRQEARDGMRAFIEKKPAPWMDKA